MAWIAEDRRNADVKTSPTPLLTDEIKAHLQATYFHRYPTRRAVLMPALHYVQHIYNYLPLQVIQELAEFLQLAPAEALDTASFYEEYHLKPKGKYLIAVCRSLACEICGSKDLSCGLREKLGIDFGQTTPDRKFTLIEVECLGSCGTAPAVLINQTLHENVTPATLDKVISSVPDDPNEYRDPSLTMENQH